MSSIIHSALLFFIFTCGSNVSYGQDLWKQKVIKMSSGKQGNYNRTFSFFRDTSKKTSNNACISSVRQFYSEKEKKERIVVDIADTESIPKVYGYVAGDERKVYIDIFNSKIAPKIESLGTGKYVLNINIYPIEKDHLSIELELDRNLVFEVFYLEKPARLVIDAKENSK